jgi:mono/diheme cytochrome c family protein
MRRAAHEKIGFVMVSLKSGFPFILLAILTAVSFPACAASSDSDADLQSGAVLYRDKGCARCHGAALDGTPKGPALADINNDKEWPPEKLSDHILDGGQKMPPFRESLTDEEIAQLVAYLRAKNRPVLPQPANGSDPAPAPAPKH